MPRIAHKPTEEGRRQVEAMSGYGVRQEVIAKVLLIGIKTLHKYYRSELDSGDGKAQEAIGQALFDKAVNDKCTASLIFLAKTRLKLREVQEVRIGDTDGKPVKFIVEIPGITDAT